MATKKPLRKKAAKPAPRATPAARKTKTAVKRPAAKQKAAPAPRRRARRKTTAEIPLPPQPAAPRVRTVCVYYDFQNVFEEFAGNVAPEQNAGYRATLDFIERHVQSLGECRARNLYLRRDKYRHQAEIVAFHETHGYAVKWGPFQKDIDTTLAADLQDDAARDAFDVCVVITGDADFIAPLAKVRERGKEIHVLSMKGTYRRGGIELSADVFITLPEICRQCRGQGTATQKCRKCGGTGRYILVCRQCNGHGQRRLWCAHCKGSGRLAHGCCRDCEEHGVTRAVACAACGGKGEQDGKSCVVCQGAGRRLAPCEKCKGTGMFPFEQCPVCQGRGRLDPAICPQCHGRGESDKGECWDCKGKGVREFSCQACRGSGLRVPPAAIG